MTDGTHPFPADHEFFLKNALENNWLDKNPDGKICVADKFYGDIEDYTELTEEEYDAATLADYAGALGKMGFSDAWVQNFVALVPVVAAAPLPKETDVRLPANVRTAALHALAGNAPADLHVMHRDAFDARLQAMLPEYEIHVKVQAELGRELILALLPYADRMAYEAELAQENATNS